MLFVRDQEHPSKLEFTKAKGIAPRGRSYDKG